MFRLSLPERIPIAYAFLFASALFLFQQIEHTPVYFSACGFLFIVVSTQAFNIAGGLTRPSGGYIFFYAVLGVILGLVVKAFLGEPADSNLLRPHLTITIYAVSSLMLLLAACVSRRFSRKHALLGRVVSDNNMPNAAIGCLVIGLVLTILSRIMVREEGSALSALIQINHFSELAVILGVTSVIGRSSPCSSKSSSIERGLERPDPPAIRITGCGSDARTKNRPNGPLKRISSPGFRSPCR